MGHRADWKQCSVKLVGFLSRRLSSTCRWNGRGIVCLPSRSPVFLKIKNKKNNHGRAGKSGRSGMINNFFFLLGLTWADGVKVADGRTRNLSLRKRCTDHTTGTAAPAVLHRVLEDLHVPVWWAVRSCYLVVKSGNFPRVSKKLWRNCSKFLPGNDKKKKQ